MHQPIALRGKERAIQDYKSIVLHDYPDALLLLDSDGPDNGRLFKELQQKFKKFGLEDRLADNIFWMVEIMESWFLADREGLQRYFGKGFRPDRLPGNPDVERVPKKDVERGLKAATRETAQGEYHKTRHAPELLAQIKPERVQDAASNCKRLFGALNRSLSAS